MAVLAPDAVLAEPVARDDHVYTLAAGTELLGEFQDAGYQTAKFLIRRSDGQLMQLPLLLYRLAASLDGRTAEEIASDLSAELGRELTGEQVSYLVSERLHPVGLIAADPLIDERSDGPAPPPVRADPLLALRYRVGVVPASVSWRIAGIFRPFFHRPVWVLLLAAFVTADVLIVLEGNLGARVVGGLGQMIQRPGLNLLIIGLVILALAFHECGHVTACRYGGARPGDMGVGLYLVWPAFYSTVTDSYRLNRIGRLRTDLGGVYFNALFIAGTALVYLRTGEPWLLIALLLLHLETAWQFLPSIRFDGYYMLSDLVGVPELFSFVRPVLAGLLPGRAKHPRVGELRPWSRRVIVLWVAVTVPVLLFYLAAFVLLVPRALPVVWQQVQQYQGTVGAAVRAGDVVTVSLYVFQLFLIVVPWLGTVLIVLSLVGQLRRAVVRRWGWTWGTAATWHALRRSAAGGMLLGFAGALVWRVAVVAATAPADATETRLVTGEVERSPFFGIGVAEAYVHEQFRGYVTLVRAFGAPAGGLTSARQLAVVATALLVLSFLGVGRALRWRYWAMVPPLAMVAVMGPAVSVLAHLSPGLVGSAWVSVGVACVVSALRGQGRHRLEQRRGGSLVLATLGGVAVLVGVVSEPLVLVPLAVVGALVALQLARRSQKAPGWEVLVGGAFLVATAAGLVVPPLLGLTSGPALGAPERRVLLLVAAVLVIGGVLQGRVRRAAAVAAAPVALAALPAPGADALLPLVVCAVAGLAAVVIQVWTRHPVAERPHPLLRAVLVVPALILVIVGALYAPALPGQPGGHQLRGAHMGPQPVAQVLEGGAAPSAAFKAPGARLNPV